MLWHELKVANRDKIINHDISYFFRFSSSRVINHNFSTISCRILSTCFSWWSARCVWRFVMNENIFESFFFVSKLRFCFLSSTIQAAFPLLTITKTLQFYPFQNLIYNLVRTFNPQVCLSPNFTIIFSFPSDTSSSNVHISMRERTYRMRKVSSKNTSMSNVPCSDGTWSLSRSG
jgi:hypothetical protein